MQRRRGFTLIELLIVIAIVGLLSAMLFPAFARAREQSRAFSCLSNVQTIARALRMYATDYDGKLLPSEHDPTVAEYFTSQGCDVSPGCCDYNTMANPYLRPPVILSSYLRNRSVWRCPQAKASAAAEWILPIGPDGSWFDGSIRSICVCAGTWPAGWGGTVTDSHAQCGEVGTGAFTQSIATSAALVDLSLTQVGAPSRFLAVGDGGQQGEFDYTTQLAFPDWCRARPEPDCGADWVNCPESQQCGLDTSAKQWLITNAWHRRSFTRHYGGTNVGFLDGHATWVSAEFLLRHTTPFRYAIYTGACSCWPGNGVI